MDFYVRCGTLWNQILVLKLVWMEIMQLITGEKNFKQTKCHTVLFMLHTCWDSKKTPFQLWEINEFPRGGNDHPKIIGTVKKFATLQLKWPISLSTLTATNQRIGHQSRRDGKKLTLETTESDRGLKFLEVTVEVEEVALEEVALDDAALDEARDLATLAALAFSKTSSSSGGTFDSRSFRCYDLTEGQGLSLIFFWKHRFSYKNNTYVEHL